MVGWLAAPPLNASPALVYFRRRMADLGYVEGKNVKILYRSAEFHPEPFTRLAQELVQARVSVIAAVSGLPAARAAKAATSTIAIVFLTPGDPVRLGLVASLSRPDGNPTGVSIADTALAVKNVRG
ncbi:MAG TPA: ABC transporter substrate binding protein [Acetobacteraceae bacterium]|nr:ABC transporter substrate binding protein [Acetobacteraceae bacterium]